MVATVSIADDVDSDEFYMSVSLQKFLLDSETILSKKQIDLCNYTSSITGGNETCPYAGEYAFLFDYPVPGFFDFPIGWKMNTYITIYDGQDNILGKFDVSISTKNIESDADTDEVGALSMVFGVLAVTGLGIYAKKKRRAMVTVEDEEENNFVRMPDMIEISRMPKGESAFV